MTALRWPAIWNLSGLPDAVKTRGFYAETTFKKNGSFLLDTIHETPVPLQKQSHP